MPSCGDEGGRDLGVRDGLGGCDGIPPAVKGPVHHRGPPRIFPPVHILPSQLDIVTGHPVAVSPRCPSLGTPRAGPEFPEEGVHLAR